MVEQDETDTGLRSTESRRALSRFAWIFGSGLALALTFPQVLFAATMSSFLGIGAGIMATIALYLRDDLWSDHITRWDVAAALYAASLFASFFVDLQAIQVFLMEHASTLG